MGLETDDKKRLIKLVYIIGRYPELTNTFIDREIDALKQIGDFQIQTVSLRYPLTPEDLSPEHQSIRRSTIYLIPKRWIDFDIIAFICNNLYFMFHLPRTYWGTLIYLFSGAHPSLLARVMTILHFGLGVHAAGLLRTHDFDHLHAHFIDRSVIVALVVGRLLHKTYSMTAHAVDIYTKTILIREKLINAKFIVTVSQYNKAHLLNTYPGFDVGKIHVLHPWVDLSNFTPLIQRPKHDKFHIVSIGRLVEKKGYDDLIKACSLLRQQGLNFECRIVGDGPLKNLLEERVTLDKLQNQVYLVGGQPQSYVKQLLESWCDVFVLSCVISRDGDRDGIPVSLAEAMAMELPVISTDIVGICELVKSEAGILVPPHDPDSLVIAILDIFNESPSTRAEMGRRGRTIVDEEFNLRKGVNELARLYREAIACDSSG